MRATSSVVVLSSSLLAATVLAGPADKTGKTPASSTSKTSSKPTTAPGAGSAAGSAATSAGSAATGTGSAGSAAGSAATPAIDPATVKPEDMPTAVRMRRLEQQTQALKERAWQLKARVQMLKETVLGGGVGAQAVIAHASEMGASFRLTKLIYALDGTQVFARTDDSGESLYKTNSFDVFAGPISPGNHNLTAVATYRGHGYGVFEYLSKYTFTARGNQAFVAGEGKISKVDCRGFEKGGPTTPLEKRASIECKVTQVQPEKSERPDKADKADKADKPASSPASPASPAPGAAPSPAAPATPAAPSATGPGK